MTRKGFQADRLALGEWIDGVGGLILACAIIGGWHGQSIVLSAICAVNGLLALAVWLTCATRRSPAVALSLSVIQTGFALISSIWLLIVLLVGSGSGAGRPIALLGAILTAAGIYLSFRREGVPPADAPSKIETLRVKP